jgi:hypothetical protein
MEGVAKDSESATLERILISYSEYERLKNIEKEYTALQQQQQQHKHSSHTEDFDPLGQDNLKLNQYGEGDETSSKKAKFEDIIQEPSVLEKIADLVASKIQTTSTSTDLFKSKEQSSPLTIGIATPITTPPLPYGFALKKDDENDDFGKLTYFLYLSFLNN